MNQIFPINCEPASCVYPADLVGYTQLAFAQPVSGSCVNPADLVGFTQLPDAGLALTKRFFTQLGLIGGVDGKP
jgi:hypothetical protein